MGLATPLDPLEMSGLNVYHDPDGDDAYWRIGESCDGSLSASRSESL